MAAGTSITVTECQALVEDGTQGCLARATWRVVADGGEEWLICQPHLGETIMLVHESYGGPVSVFAYH